MAGGLARKVLIMRGLFLSAVATLAIAAFTIDVADAKGRARGARPNAAGGITAGGVHNTVGPNGAASFGARGLVTDGSGSGVAGSANCAAGAAGQACRAGSTAFASDGSVVRKGGATVEGANGGSASTTSGFTRNADGAYSGGRATQATGAAGNTYSGQTTYDSATGVTRSATCADASGAAIACPTR